MMFLKTILISTIILNGSSMQNDTEKIYSKRPKINILNEDLSRYEMHLASPDEQIQSFFKLKKNDIIMFRAFKNAEVLYFDVVNGIHFKENKNGEYKINLITFVVEHARAAKEGGDVSIGKLKNNRIRPLTESDRRMEVKDRLKIHFLKYEAHQVLESNVGLTKKNTPTQRTLL